jgi:hypothetical protein
MKNIIIDINPSQLDIYEKYHKIGTNEWRAVAAKDKAAHILFLCNDLKINKLVEVGAGEGSVLLELERNNFKADYYALEVAQTAVDAIQNRDIKSLKDVSLFDGYQIPYDDNYFDLSILTHVLEHVEHPRLLLTEVKRVSKNIFVEVPLENNAQGRKDQINAIKYGHINYYDLFNIRMLYATVGLKITRDKIFNNSKHIFKYQSGKLGIIKYLVKEAALKAMPSIALKLFSYVYAAKLEKV